MISYNNRISLRQFQILTILNVLGTGILVLPRRVATVAMEDSWLSIIIGTIFAIISTMLMFRCIRNFPSSSFKEAVTLTFGKVIGIIICFIFVFKIVTTVGLELRIFGEITKQVLLPKTPTIIISSIMVLMCGFVASKGLEVRARVSEILIYVVVLFVIITIFLSSYHADFTNLLPLLKTSPKGILDGSFITFFVFSSVSYMLLSYPYVYNKKEFGKGSIIAVLVLGFIMVLVTVIAIAKFSAKGVERQLWPVLDMMNAIDLPGSFVERQDSFVMSFWIFIVFASINAGLFYTAILLKSIFKKIRHSHCIFFCMILILLISLVPDNMKIASISLDYIYALLSSFFMVVLPIIMIFTYKIRKMRPKNENN